MIDQLFFQLLQVAIGTRKALSINPSADEWADLFALSKKQALAGIAFAGLTKHLASLGDSPYAEEIKGTGLYVQWLGLAAKISQRNRKVSAACAEVVKQYNHDGIACCILKGQSNLEYYPESLKELRMPGDIDVWCEPADACGIDIAVSDLDGNGAHYETYHGKRAVVEYVMMLHRTAGTQPRGGIRYHHIGAPQINGVDVEAHFRPLFLDSPLRNWRVQRWFLDNAQFGLLDAKVADAVLPVPTVSFNAVYQLCHIYRHLFDEGIGLRQLLDYYFVLRALHIEQGELSDRTESMAQFSCKREEKLRACSQVIPNRGSSESRVNVRIHFAESRTRKTLVNAAEIRRSQWAEGMGIAVKSNAEIMHTLGRFGMKKFAGAVMYVLQTVFAMPSVYMICEPDEKRGKFLLGEIMQAGNFGQFDGRIKRPR